MGLSDHLADVDFRSREERQKNAKEDFIEWYKKLSARNLSEPFDDMLYGQQIMLSNVLWYLLPEKEYNKLTRVNK